MTTETVKEREIALNICDVRVFNKPVRITCHGLGSCIALFVFDRKTQISGGAHIMLPAKTANCSVCISCFAAEAVENLLSQMKNLGSDLLSLRAKLVGGANVINMSNSIGEDNLQMVFNQLINKGVLVAGMDVGGKISRTARFNSLKGEVEITSSHNKHYQLTL